MWTDLVVFAEPEITEFNVSIFVKEYVIGLDVSVYVVEGVDLFKGQDALCCVEPGLMFSEDIFFYELGHQVSSRKILHDQIQVVLVLEGLLEVDDPLLLALGKDVSFCVEVAELVLLDHLGLFHFFDSH